MTKVKPFKLTEDEDLSPYFEPDEEDIESIEKTPAAAQTAINDEFEEIVTKSKRSQSQASLEFSRPLTSHHCKPRRQSSSSWEQISNSEIFINRSDLAGDSSDANDMRRTSPTFDFYGPLPERSIEDYLRFSSNLYFHQVVCCCSKNARKNAS